MNLPPYTPEALTRMGKRLAAQKTHRAYRAIAGSGQVHTGTKT